jgi:RNase P subunit RPR2
MVIIFTFSSILSFSPKVSKCGIPQRTIPRTTNYVHLKSSRHMRSEVFVHLFPLSFKISGSRVCRYDQCHTPPVSAISATLRLSVRSVPHSACQCDQCHTPPVSAISATLRLSVRSVPHSVCQCDQCHTPHLPKQTAHTQQ